MAVEVWWSSLVAADRGLTDVLDPVERARLETMQRPADRGRSLVGFALLRAAVGAHQGIAPHDVVVERTCEDCGGPHGRPRVVGAGGRAPWVSVSHSGVQVVVALCPQAPVGVDVQRVADLAAAEPGAAAGAAERWVRAEAVAKLGALDPGQPVDVRSLEVPADGYVAALATAAAGPVDVRVRQWPLPGP